MSVEATVEQFGLQALDNIKTKLADKWDALTPEQKQSAARAAKRVVKLDLQRRTLIASGGDLTQNTEDLEFVKVTISEFEIAGEIALTSAFQEAFWEGVNKALEALGSFLVGAGKGIIPGL
jgi:hypothetical protein